MKHYLLACLLMAACTGTHRTGKSTAALQGSWKLVYSLVDIGDGNAHWTPADPDQPVIISFNGESQLFSQPGAPAQRYRVLSPNQVAFIRPGADSIVQRFHFKGDTLELFPPCIEACGQQYVKWTH